ncbi:MAG: ACT domain-containing protein, partial [Microbacteriaceae bacterium]|nr:ACT domain-containing protein [Microbacteriaceae bacterium]
AQIFTIVADANANVDMIVQNVSTSESGRTDISFTLPKSDVPAVLAALEGAKAEVGFVELRHDEDIAKVSVVGAGMRSSAGVSAKLFTALFEAGINMEMISTSEIRISVVTRAGVAAAAARAIHTAFGLDGDADAIVYAGTGR